MQIERERGRFMQIERERERERLQKMGTTSLQTDHRLLQSRKKRSFSLPRFKRSSAGEPAARNAEEVARSAEEAARVQKAAAWQWYTRGVGEVVLPTKRPPVRVSTSTPSPGDKSVVDGKSIKGREAITNILLPKKPPEPPLADSAARAASRFKADARFAPPTSAGGTQPTPSAGPATPLYDEFELSSLRTQMAEFVQRLQLHQQTKDNEPSAQKSKPQLQVAVVDGHPLPAAASVSTDHHQIKPPAPSVAVSSDHQLTKTPPASAAPVASTIPFHMRPFSALHRLFRKVVSGSIIKSTKNSPLLINSSPAIYETEVLPEEDEENTPYHHHHYIHHHHHHYHYGQSPETSPAMIIRSRRRHSESSGIGLHLPSLLEAEFDELEEEDIEAYLARRRRHSDSNFAGVHLTQQKADFDEEEDMEGSESAKEALPRQLPRRYKSERFAPNKIPTMVSEDLAQATTDEFDEGFPDIRSRRRHSAENQREGKAGGGGKNGGRTYKLGGAPEGATLVRRRHSEAGWQRPEGVHDEMGKRSPSAGKLYSSARYLEDVLERQIGALALANAAPARRPRPPPGLPPIYPQ